MTLPYSDIKQARSPGLTAKGDRRQYVKHSYTDRSNDIVENLTESDENTLRLYREDTVGGTFPIKLQIVLNIVEKLGKQHIISWLPHGRAFMIHRPREFEMEVMGEFFKQTKLTSFQRQLNLYDFQRITHGRDAGSYYHELFLKGRPLLAKRVIRRKVKGTKIRASSSPDDEPNFYAMPFVAPLREMSYSKVRGGVENSLSRDPILGAPPGTNLPSLPPNLNDSLNGLSSVAAAASLRNMYDQSSLSPLGEHSGALQNSSLLNSLPSPLRQSPYSYSDLMQSYGGNTSPISQTLAGSLDNLNYSNSLAASANRNYLGSSFPSQYDRLAAAEARYQAELALLHQNPALYHSMAALRPPAAPLTGIDPRLSHLNEVAIAGDNLNAQLLLRQLQKEQQKNALLESALQTTSPQK